MLLLYYHDDKLEKREENKLMFLKISTPQRNRHNSMKFNTQLSGSGTNN